MVQGWVASVTARGGGAWFLDACFLGINVSVSDNFGKKNTIDPSECGRGRPGFGGDAVSEKLRRIQYYRVLNIINLKLYNVL